MASQLAGMALLLGCVAASSCMAQAEQPTASGKSLISDRKQAIDATAYATEPSGRALAKEPGKSAKPKAKAAAGAQPLTPAQQAVEASRTDSHSKKPAADVKEAAVPLGRIPLQTGTFGFDAGTKSNAREFPDGRRLPAYETLKREGGLPFIGLSLSVPTSSIPLFSGSSPKSTD